MIKEDTLNIYADGSSFSHPRRGGIGIRFICVDQHGNEEIEDIPEFCSYPGATNNEMELQACIVALERAAKSDYVETVSNIVVFTDSLYVVDNYWNALCRWPGDGWLTRDGNPVLNVKLWKRLAKAFMTTGKRTEFEWIKGHSGDEHSNAVDRMAKESAKSPLKKSPLSIVEVRKKKTSSDVDLQSVEMRGQRLSIRIITAQYLSTQKLSKYKYEVISKRSKYYKNVDLAYSQLDLAAGHEYVVSFNKKTNTPRILRMIEELERE